MSNLNKILKNKNLCKSIWFMRQAGRYLPEFRKIRSENKNFVKLCLNSELSSEISLQPIKRFDLDSAIIFSDILMVPYALGQEVIFIKNKSPKLSEFNFKKFKNNKEKEFSKKLDPVYKAINITREKLDIKKSLISFVGAPWTLLIYMLDLKEENNEVDKSKLNRNKPLIDQILNDLTQYLCLHIKNQINAGADVVQIFDSWSGLIPNENLTKFSYSPNSELVKFCKTYNVPSICFPKGLKRNYETFNNLVKPDGINLDYEIDPLWAKNKLKDVVIQGGMDPKVLFKSNIKIHSEATKYIQAFKDTPYIFNLGHGLLPETDPDKVDKLIKFYRNFE